MKDFLVEKEGPGQYGFLELKTGSDTPLFAALEISIYGVIYLFWRLHLPQLKHDRQPMEILEAARINLRVLAPDGFYHDSRYKLGWLERKLDEGFKALLQEKNLSGRLEMGIRLDAFPPSFRPGKGTQRKDALDAFEGARPAYPR